VSLAVVDGFEVVRAEEPDEPFQAGSVSKSVAAYAALRLLAAADEQGWSGLRR
jgi:CubicO group peptidase (beta-lactamase class C family)